MAPLAPQISNQEMFPSPLSEKWENHLPKWVIYQYLLGKNTSGLSIKCSFFLSRRFKYDFLGVSDTIYFLRFYRIVPQELDLIYRGIQGSGNFFAPYYRFLGRMPLLEQVFCMFQIKYFKFYESYTLTFCDNFRSGMLFLKYFVWSKEATADNDDGEYHINLILGDKIEIFLTALALVRLLWSLFFDIFRSDTSFLKYFAMSNEEVSDNDDAKDNMDTILDVNIKSVLTLQNLLNLFGIGLFQIKI